jgi:hypothetical protein
MANACARKCDISEQQVSAPRYQCSALLKDNISRCQRIRVSGTIFWRKINGLFFPFCSQHVRDSKVFDEALGVPTVQQPRSPIKGQGFALGPNCLPVQRDIKENCELKEDALPQTTCWVDVSQTKSPAIASVVNKCKKRRPSRSRNPVLRDTKPKGKLSFLTVQERWNAQNQLTKQLATHPGYEKLAWNILQNITKVLDKTFHRKAALVLKGSRAINLALSQAVTHLFQLKNAFPIFSCTENQLNVAKTDLMSIVPPSDYDAQLILDYPERRYSDAVRIAEDLIRNIFVETIETHFQEGKQLVEWLVSNPPRDFKYDLEAFPRRSFQIQPKVNFSFSVRKFVQFVVLEVDHKDETVTFTSFDSNLNRVSLGDIPDVFNVTQIEPERSPKGGKWEYSYQMETGPWKAFLSKVPETHYSLLSYKIYESKQKFPFYMTSSHLRFYDRQKVVFHLLRFMAGFQIHYKKLSAKTKAEIVDISIDTPGSETFEHSQIHFIEEQKEYTFRHEGVLVGNLKYHEDELTRLLSSKRAKGDKDKKRIEHIYYFVCCISQLAELGVKCQKRCIGQNFSHKNFRVDIIKRIRFSIQEYAEYNFLQLKPFLQTLNKFSPQTLQFIYLFINQMTQKLPKDNPPSLTERRKQVKNLETLFKAVRSKSCPNLKTLLGGLKTLFNIDHLEEDGQALEAPLSSLFQIHGFNEEID